MNEAKIFRLFLLLTLCFALPACGRTSPSAAATKFGDNARQALIKALQAKLDARSYRMKMEQSSTVGMSNTQQADYVAPDRYRVSVEMRMNGRESGKQEMIVVGQQGYSKTPEGNWRKIQIDPQQLEFARVRDRMQIENLNKAKDADVKFSGGAQDGMQAFVYEQSVTAAPKTVMRSKTTTWVGIADGLPRKVELVADTDFDGSQQSIKVTTTYYDYNAGIKIEAPM